MNAFHHLQLRFPAERIVTGGEIVFQGEPYTLGRTVSETLHPGSVPFGVLMTGYTAQYELLRGAQTVGAAWFYFYRAHEGVDWAVLDEARLEAADQAV